MLKVFAVNSLESVQNSTFSYFPGTFGYVIATSRKPLMNSVCTKLRKWHKKEKAAAAAIFHKQQQLNWIKNILSVTHIKHFKITYAYLKFRRHEPAGCYVAACLEKEEEVTIRWAPGISHGWLTSWSEPYKSAIDSSIHHFFTLLPASAKTAKNLPGCLRIAFGVAVSRREPGHLTNWHWPSRGVSIAWWMAG